MKRIASDRKSRTITSLYALVVMDVNGVEGILRRDTPYGTQPWITDDLALIRSLRLVAAQDAHIDSRDIVIVRFDRALAYTEYP